MGNAGSVDAQQPELRAHSAPLKLPMPEPGELEERFAVVLVSPIVCRRPAGGGEGEKGRGKKGREGGRQGEEREGVPEPPGVVASPAGAARVWAVVWVPLGEGCTWGAQRAPCAQLHGPAPRGSGA